MLPRAPDVGFHGWGAQLGARELHFEAASPPVGLAGPQ